jgi:hypothetical protein
MLAKCNQCGRLIWAGLPGDTDACKTCIGELRPTLASEIGPDRFWIPMTLIPLGMMAGLALLVVVMMVAWR